ncbi:MDR family MFS transporter [Paenibacillus cremeus]|uniref:MFS transporter n=1 Tax=Paenibacillus cremeus TaxID=2163881 RepID=A0A559K0D5_9BACL|nr:MFS transporter [Paenibacillus cremeus]TVY05510.1 MFS transporter [Paenibacillus cremeus]
MKKAEKSAFSFHPIVQCLFAGTAMSRIATSMTVPFLTIFLAKHTDMSPAGIGFTVGAGALAGMLFGFFGGALSDKWGRLRILNVSLWLWAAVFFLFAWNTYTPLFVLLNVLNGLCRSSFEPVSVALISDLTPSERRVRAYSIRYTWNNVGFAIGPIVGALMGLNGGDAAFVVTGAFYALYAFALFILLKIYNVKDSEDSTHTVHKEPITLGLALQTVARDRALLWFLLGGILMQFTYSQLSTMAPFVADHFDKGVWLYSWLMTTNGLTVICCQIPLTFWSEKRSPLVSVKAGNVLYALGGLGFALADSWWAMIAAMVVFSIGEVLCFPAGNALTDMIAPEKLRGAYFGAQTFRELGRFAGPLVGMPLLSHWGMLPLFIVVGVLSLLSTTCYRSGEKHMERPSHGTEPALAQ